MINYNIGDAITRYSSLLSIVGIYFALVITLYISVKIMKPVYLGWGRIFMGALIWLSTHIVLSLIFFKTPIVVTILTPIAWYFETKFLWEYDWLKAALTLLIQIPTLIAAVVVTEYTIFGLMWLLNTIFPGFFNFQVFQFGLRLF